MCVGSRKHVCIYTELNLDFFLALPKPSAKEVLLMTVMQILKQFKNYCYIEKSMSTLNALKTERNRKTHIEEKEGRECAMNKTLAVN